MIRSIKNTFKKIWEDESGQGATEYILMLVVVVGIAILFRKQFVGKIGGLVNNLTEQLTSFIGTANKPLD